MTEPIRCPNCRSVEFIAVFSNKTARCAWCETEWSLVSGFDSAPMVDAFHAVTEHVDDQKLEEPNVVLVGADDWSGLYVDGVLKYEGHSIPDFLLLQALGIPFRELDAQPFFEVDAHDGIGLPEKLEDLTIILESVAGEPDD